MTPRDELSTLIREEVLADEPPFDPSPDGVLLAGRRALRRRRTVVAARVLAVAAVVAVAVPMAWASNEPSSKSEAKALPAAAQEAYDEFDPYVFPSVVDDEVRAHLGSAIPSELEGRIEPVGSGGAGMDVYAYTDSWEAEYTLSPTHTFELLMHWNGSGEGDPAVYCRDKLQLYGAVRCDFDVLPDGSVTITWVYPTGDAKSGDLGFVRQVTHRRSYGYAVIAREIVRTRTIAEANARWAIEPEQLARLATSPRLVYKIPTEGKACENPTYLMLPHRETVIDCSGR